MRSIDGIRGRRKKQGKGTESKQKLKEETQQSKKKKKKNQKTTAEDECKGLPRSLNY